MTGRQLNETLGKIHFWGMFVAFNSTFLPLFAVGMMGMPRRVVTYAPHLQWLNDWVSISAFCLGVFMLVFLANLVWSQIIRPVAPGANPWARSRPRVARCPRRCPAGNFAQVPDDPRRPVPVRGAERPARRRSDARSDPGRVLTWRPTRSSPIRCSQAQARRSRPRRGRATCAWAHACCGCRCLHLPGFLFAYLYLRSLNEHGSGGLPHTSPSLALGLVTLLSIVGSAGALIVAPRALRAGKPRNWRAGALLRPAARRGAVAQGWQLVDPGFSPYHAGAFGSLFVGFTATLFAHLIGATYWLETVVVSSGAFHREREGVAKPLGCTSRLRARTATYALFLAGVEIVAFVLIYLA